MSAVADKYPLPSYAVSAWVAGDSLFIAFPGTVTEQGHTIKLPASSGGLQAAINIMRQRASALDLRVGNRGTPTQYDLERISEVMKGFDRESSFKREARAKEAVEAAEFLKELGL